MTAAAAIPGLRPGPGHRQPHCRPPRRRASHQPRHIGGARLRCTGRWSPAERPWVELQLITTPAQLRTDRSPAYRHASDPAALAGCARCLPPIVESFHVPASPFPRPALPGPVAAVRRTDRPRQDDHWTFELAAGGGVAPRQRQRGYRATPSLSLMSPRRVDGFWAPLALAGAPPSASTPRARMSAPAASARKRTRCSAVPTPPARHG